MSSETSVIICTRIYSFLFYVYITQYEDIRHKLEQDGETYASGSSSDAFSSAINPPELPEEIKRHGENILEADVATVESEEEEDIVVSEGDVDIGSEDELSDDADFFDASQGLSRMSVKKSAR